MKSEINFLVDILFSITLRFIMKHNYRMPMQKNFTLSEKESTIALTNKSHISKELHPQKVTLQKILQFAAIYKTVKITDTWIIDIYLN